GRRPRRGAGDRVRRPRRGVASRSRRDGGPAAAQVRGLREVRETRPTDVVTSPTSVTSGSPRAVSDMLSNVTTPQDLDERFRAALAGLTPAPDRRDPEKPVRDGTALTGAQARRLFDAQLASRHLDLAARWLRSFDEGYYTIASAGPERAVARRRARRVLVRRRVGQLRQRHRRVQHGGLVRPQWTPAAAAVRVRGQRDGHQRAFTRRLGPGGAVVAAGAEVLRRGRLRP